MKVIVNPHKVELIQEELVNEKELGVSKCKFEFDERITEDFTKEAYFTFNGNTYKQIIVNNECDFPHEVLEENGEVEIGVVAFKIDGDNEIRFNPSPRRFYSLIGSLKDAENSEPITPSEMDQFEQALNEGLREAENVDIDAEKVGNKATVTITNRLGEEKSVDIYDGDSGITFFSIENGHLMASSESGAHLDNYNITNGHLMLTIGE